MVKRAPITSSALVGFVPAGAGALGTFMQSNASDFVRKLHYHARVMRLNPTTSEYALWYHLRAKKLHGVTFRRQQVVGRRIVDFLAPKLKLVVEVQGGYHLLTESADAKRCAQLNRAGYTVVYVEAALVLQQPEAAVEIVRAAVGKLLG